MDKVLSLLFAIHTISLLDVYDKSFFEEANAPQQGRISVCPAVVGASFVSLFLIQGGAEGMKVTR
jgi:hypothetical protein